MADLRPQVGDSTNLLLKKLVTATDNLSGGGGVFLTEGEADLLYLKQLSNLSDLNNFTTARDNLGLGASDTPVFTGINFGNVNVLSGFAAGQIALNHVGGTTPAIVLQENGVDAGYWSSSSTNGRLNAQGTLSLTSGDTGASILLGTAAGGGIVTLTPSGTGSVDAVFNTSTITPAFQGVHVTGKAATNSGFTIDAFAALGVFNSRRANGTIAAPTALVANDQILNFGARGYGATGYSAGSRGAIVVSAMEGWTDAIQSTFISLQSTPRGGAVAYTPVHIGRESLVEINQPGQAISQAAWGTKGPVVSYTSSTFIDTTSSGAVATTTSFSSLGIPTLNSTSAANYSILAGLNLLGDPVVTGNATLSATGVSYAFNNEGKSRFAGAVTLPSTNALGIQLYNTADQTTNYERLEALWSSNTAFLRAVAAGTGTPRSLQVGATFGSIVMRGTSSTSGGVQFNCGGSSSLASIMGFSFANFSSTATSGTNVCLSLTPIYNQASGNASNTDFLLNRTQTAIGSGAQRLISLQVAGSAQFEVDNAGRTACGAAALSSTTALITPAGTTSVSSLRIPHGSAPSSPVDGDMWTTTAGLFVRINGVTVGPLS